MQKHPTMYASNTNSKGLNARQLAFFAALVVPVGKILELPSLLTAYAGGDLLIAAVCGCLLEFLSFGTLVWFAKRSGSSPMERLRQTLGNATARIFLGVYALFLLVYATLPLFDLERFSHAAFSDTSPTFFTFTPFFLLCGFLCAKGLKGVGRYADLSPVLCLFPLLLLLGMSAPQADFSRLLPVMEKPISVSLKAVWRLLPYFSVGGILLPLMGEYTYSEGDEKKLLPAFGVGAILSLLFLATFFGVFGLLGETEKYAVIKIGQFFPALRFIGRVDLLVAYVLTVVLFFYTALPLQLSVECFCRCANLRGKAIPSAVLCVGAYFVLLFLNKYNNTIHNFFFTATPPVFLLFSVVVPWLFLAFLSKNKGSRYASSRNTAQNSGEK